MAFENATPIIENTTMRKYINDSGVAQQYWIKPIDGYVLHDKNYDEIEYDPDTFEPTGNVTLGYRTSEASVSINYDFVENPREFYAVLRTEVPENQIFGGGNNDHEIM